MNPQESEGVGGERAWLARLDPAVTEASPGLFSDRHQHIYFLA